jgi:hypothetical protein
MNGVSYRYGFLSKIAEHLFIKWDYRFVDAFAFVSNYFIDMVTYSIITRTIFLSLLTNFLFCVCYYNNIYKQVQFGTTKIPIGILVFGVAVIYGGIVADCGVKLVPPTDKISTLMVILHLAAGLIGMWIGLLFHKKVVDITYKKVK